MVTNLTTADISRKQNLCLSTNFHIMSSSSSVVVAMTLMIMSFTAGFS